MTAFYNTQFILIGKLISSGLLVAQGTFAAEIDIVKALVHNDVISQAVAAAVPVSTQITPLFNLNSN